MPVTSWKSAGTGASVYTGVGNTAWFSTERIVASDDSRASANPNALSQTYQLRATNFGFVNDVPEGATIDGIEVRIERYGAAGAGGGTSPILDEEARLVHGTAGSSADNIGTDQITDSLNVPTGAANEAYRTIGSATNKWGASLTAAMVRSTSFGVGYRANNGGSSQLGIFVDHIEMRVHYTAPAITGSASATLAPLTSSSSAQLPIRGLAGTAMGALTSASAAALAISGGGSPALAPVTSSAEAALKVAGALTAALAALTGTSQGKLIAQGALAATLAPVAANASGHLHEPGGYLFATLEPLTGTAAAELLLSGQSAVTLAPLTTEAAGRLPIQGEAAALLAALTGQGSAELLLRADAGAMLAPLQGQSIGALLVVGGYSGALAPLTLVAVGRIVVPAITPADRTVSIILNGSNEVLLVLEGSNIVTLN
jgi:hypothetical protein